MKILFTIVSIDSGNVMYLQSAKRLVNEILSQTQHDVLISTNNLSFFGDVSSERFILRNNIDPSCILKYGSEFNYNLKYNAFENISSAYDVIIYLDCDIKLDGWNQNSDNHIDIIFKNHDFGATRLNCSMIGSIEEYKKTGKTLFSHKINSYKILENYVDSDDIMHSLLPSEHFLIFKNDTDKMKKFYNKWKELNNHLQSINGEGGSWGDGFEIGISARYAGFHNPIEINQGAWDGILGFKFNGNKFSDNIIKRNLPEMNGNITKEINSNEDFEPLDLLRFLRNSFKKETVSFIQIGVNDGKTHDIANDFLKENDVGYFIEPIESTFEIMKQNKINFKNAKFIKKAVLPEVLRGNNVINILSSDQNNEGASIGSFNKDRISSQIIVDTVTIIDFLIEEKIDELDFFFCDAESIDHLIILDLVTQLKPNVLFFETCWWCTEDHDLEMSNGKTIKIPSRRRIKSVLTDNGYDVIDYWEHPKYKREDMIAIKRNIIVNEN